MGGTNSFESLNVSAGNQAWIRCRGMCSEPQSHLSNLYNSIIDYDLKDTFKIIGKQSRNQATVSGTYGELDLSSCIFAVVVILSYYFHHNHCH